MLLFNPLSLTQLIPSWNLIQKSVDSPMKNDILDAIAVNSIFGTDEVHRVYEIFKSYDLLVAGCEFARRTGFANLESACIFAKALSEE